MSNSITRRRLMAAGTAVGCAALVPGARIALAAERSGKLEDAVEHAVRAAVDSGDIPGVVAQVWRRGELAADATAGWLDVENKIAMDRAAIFGIASMTKPVTVALALRLIDEGKLRLDDPITRWAPEFAAMRVLRRPDGPVDDTVPAARPITVEDLMTHRSGLAYGFLTPPPLGTALLSRLGMGIESDMTPDAWLKSLAEFPLVYQPGERFNYGHSIDVLGFVAARVLDTDLHRAMREQLLAPLGMDDTGFWVPPEKRARLAKFYVSTEPGQFVPSSVEPFTADRPMAFASGGQGLVSTAGDYLRFARMLMRDGRLDRTRVLKPDTARLLRTNRMTDEQRRLPFIGGAPFTQGFGLGVSVVIDENQPGIVTGRAGTFGWPGAFGGWWQADPQEELILIWLQECTPAPPQPGATQMPRMPGAQGQRQFREAVYEAIRA
jgi:CubicO group peptidase (beta-lactamase class C family)